MSKKLKHYVGFISEYNTEGQGYIKTVDGEHVFFKLFSNAYAQKHEVKRALFEGDFIAMSLDDNGSLVERVYKVSEQIKIETEHKGKI